MPPPSIAPGHLDASTAIYNCWFVVNVFPHETALRSYLRARFQSLDDTDDIVQEAYVRLIRARTAGPVTNAKSFLFTTARNIALDQIRRRQVLTTEPIDELNGPFVIDNGPVPIEAVSHDQEMQLLKEALAALPDRCREVFALRKLQGLSRKEIARRMGVSEHTINAQIAVGMLRCRKYFAERGLFTPNENEKDQRVL